MPLKEFEPKKFFNCTAETDLFRQLLQFDVDAARVVAVSDESERGKSWLLQRWCNLCLTNDPQTPVALVSLKQDVPTDDPLDFIKLIVKELNGFGVTFRKFERFNVALETNDASGILEEIKQGLINLSEANISY